MSIIDGGDLHISSENYISGEVIYRLNSNDLVKTSVLLYNSANSSEKFVKANYLIHLVKSLIIYPIPMFFL